MDAAGVRSVQNAQDARPKARRSLSVICAATELPSFDRDRQQVCCGQLMNG